MLHDVHTIKACAELDTSNGISLQPVEGGESPRDRLRFWRSRTPVPSHPHGRHHGRGRYRLGRFEVEVAGVFTDA
ncbi:hypothetical protein QJS66_02255 [Kocuria rhizophila]|nr:hypothetical protein QJS66_02255 [Kocuria rhizophila]